LPVLFCTPKRIFQALRQRRTADSGRRGSARLMLFGTQPCHASMFRRVGSLGAPRNPRIAGVQGQSPVRFLGTFGRAKSTAPQGPIDVIKA